MDGGEPIEQAVTQGTTATPKAWGTRRTPFKGGKGDGVGRGGGVGRGTGWAERGAFGRGHWLEGLGG